MSFSFLTHFLFAVLLQQIPVWRAVPDLTIGGVDNPDQAFTGVFDLEVRGDAVYSVHENEQRLRMWDAHGKLIREIGRNGNGPGEFGGPVISGWRGDTLWVFDSRQARISLFKPDGTFVRSIMAIAGGGAGSKSSSDIVGQHLLQDGTLLGQPIMDAERTSDKQADNMAFVRFRERGEVLNTLLRYQVKQSTLHLELKAASMFLTQPFSDSPLPLVDDRGNSVYLIDRPYADAMKTPAFRVRRVGLDGRVIFDRSFRYDPKPVKDAQFNRIVDQFVDNVTTSSGTWPAFMTNREEARRAVLKAMTRPKYNPPIIQAHAGGDGTLWLHREDSDAHGIWQVMDDQGRFIGMMKLPRRARMLYASRNQVWLAQRGELDVPTMVRYRISPARR